MFICLFVCLSLFLTSILIFSSCTASGSDGMGPSPVSSPRAIFNHDISLSLPFSYVFANFVAGSKLDKALEIWSDRFNQRSCIWSIWFFKTMISVLSCDIQEVMSLNILDSSSFCDNLFFKCPLRD